MVKHKFSSSLSTPVNHKMNFLSIFVAVATFISCAAAASSLEIRDRKFSQITGLTMAAHLNGTYAMVTGPVKANGRVPILAILESNVSGFDVRTDTAPFSPEKYFTEALIKKENLVDFDWAEPKQRTMAEMMSSYESTGSFGSNWVDTPLTEDNKKFLGNVALLLWNLCESDPERFLSDAAVEARLRVIGAWIYQKFSHTGMVYVAEKNRAMKPFIERAWDRIGVWMA